MGRALLRVLMCSALLGGMGAALAQPYPTHAVTLIVPYGAGVNLGAFSINKRSSTSPRIAIARVACSS